ncbi:MAG: MCP four helix bundle domain-containing protein [Burkholderiales bacterium]|nr:MCP four helix bundle domain-containing protein [Burkholderiales bacterium]
MPLLARWTIRVRLGGAFATVLALMVLLGIFASVQLARVNQATTEINTNWLPSVDTAWEIAQRVTRYRTSEYRLLAVGPDKKQDALGVLEQDIVRIETPLARYASLVASEQERQLYDKVRAQWAGYKDVTRRIRELDRRGDTAAAQQLLMGEAFLRFRDTVGTLEALVAFNREGGSVATRRSQALYDAGRLGIWALTAAAIAFGAVLAWALSRSITRPLADAVRTAQAVAGGDLSTRVQAEGRDECAQLMRSLGAMVDHLRGLVSDVRSGVDSVSTAAAQIAHGNQDLSSRTEQAAANLQQTASSMEQLTGTVTQSADTARQASQLAQQAAAAAGEGRTVVGEVVDNMREIASRSSKIGEIIGVIDGIAFQTNILALNAAVEAARAGEQGRGFAVVAGEVRTLAQRSAQAAKEIKSLIGASVETVDEGARLVESAGQAMARITDGVQRVTDLLGEISAASGEQRDGIGQVNQAVAQLDQMTQQNAALVEESTAAAGSLHEQAERLAEAVARFQVEARDR